MLYRKTANRLSLKILPLSLAALSLTSMIPAQAMTTVESTTLSSTEQSVSALQTQEMKISDGQVSRIIVSYESADAQASNVAASVLTEQDAISEATPIREGFYEGDTTTVVQTDALTVDQAQAAIDTLESTDGISSAEVDFLVENATSASFSSPQVATDWANAYLNFPAANAISTGKNATIAIVDTGLPANRHWHLNGSFNTSGIDAISDASLSNDGNGRDEDETNTSYNTGEHAQVAAHASLQGAYNSTIIFERVLGNNTNGWHSDIAAGIYHAAGAQVAGGLSKINPASVINLSMAWYSPTCPALIQDAINYAYNNRVPVIVAAGNAGANSANYAPGNCANAMNVGATDPNGALASYSNRGADVVAGGSMTYAPIGQTYRNHWGTSFAAPRVSSIAALMKDVNPSISAADIYSIILSTAKNTGAGKVPDARAAVAAAQARATPSNQSGVSNTGYKLIGGIGAYYWANGGANTFGTPTQNEFGSTLGGAVQNFSKNYALYWTPQFGTQPIWHSGAIGSYYGSQRWELGWMGYPSTPEYPRPNGAVQSFFNSKTGSQTHVYWSPKTGAQPMNGKGAIYWKWVDMGVYNTIGYPKTGEYGIGFGGVAQRFVTSSGYETSIIWSPSTGAKALNARGGIMNHWLSQGYIGKYGFPTTDESAGNGYMYVRFSNGYEIRWTAERGTWEVKL